MPSKRNAETILAALQRDPNIRVECPSCQGEFQLKRAELFYGDTLTPAAMTYLKERKESLNDRRKELRGMKNRATVVAGKTSVDVGFGKIVEKVAPMLPGFPFAAGDCRALFEPIDYVVFQGITQERRVQKIHFADVKSGKARLKESQAQIRDVVQAGRVNFVKLDV